MAENKDKSYSVIEVANMVNDSGVTLIEPDLSKLSSAELAFVKEQTGISDEDALKKHISEVQYEASKVI